MAFKMPTKMFYSKLFFAYYLLTVGLLDQSLKMPITSNYEVTKSRYHSSFFLIFLLVDGRIRIRSRTNNTDPEHCLSLCKVFCWIACFSCLMFLVCKEVAPIYVEHL